MRIAIVGSGISGLIAARLLDASHEIVVFEADGRVGGHVNTVPVNDGTDTLNIDTGFIVYNERTYPVFTRILADLGVHTQPTSMSFSVRDDRHGLEYNGTNLNGLFAQRRNLLRPSFLRLLRDILRFNREGPTDLTTVPPDQTVATYLSQKRFSIEFAEQYLLPMGAAIWSCPYSVFADFPIGFILQFYVHHGLLTLTDRPVWRVISDGSQKYVERLIEPFRSRIRVNTPVQRVTRHTDRVDVHLTSGVEAFDEIIFACHSDQALRLLTDADEVESMLLSGFPYSRNSAVLHTDETLLPKRKRAWASWNYHISATDQSRPTLTYNMNILQGLHSQHTYCVTLNEEEHIAADKVIARFEYSHPIFTATRESLQTQHERVIRHRRTSYCGAYWRNGFHEDGVVSALRVCRAYGITDWSLSPSPVTVNTNAGHTTQLG